MSAIPNTENRQVAAIAAALEIATRTRKGGAIEEHFEATLERFLDAYRAIVEALASNP